MRAAFAWLTLTGLFLCGCGAQDRAMTGGAPAAMQAEPAVMLDGGEAPEFNTEQYDAIVENPFLLSRANPLSTFAVDVDTASYANVRRMLNEGRLPPADAVRIEELVNYFHYDYAPPEGDAPFSVQTEVAPCPWNHEHHLLRIGLKGMEVAAEQRPASNLVFLLDVSGSMNYPDKLPLLKSAMKLLVDQMTPGDRVAIVVYAGAAGLVLPSTPGDEKYTILAALEMLEAGGSTAGAAGIRLAYEVAESNFIKGGINRVILATDGDFNVGTSSDGELVRLIEENAKTGVALSVLGFGTGNLKDSKMEKLADHGNGNYAYIDSRGEARKVLVEQLGGTLLTIAKDVKIQVEFNPAHVAAYRLIGYENRLLRAEDFADDAKDAGEIGAGHTVTALYELVPPGAEDELPESPPLKYQQPAEPSAAGEGPEWATVKLRYKQPQGGTSSKLSFTVSAPSEGAEASGDLKFAAAVAAFGMLLRDSQHKGTADYGDVLDLADAGRGQEPHGYRAEFIDLVNRAQALARKQK